MASKEKRSLSYYMRMLHRNIGYFVLGLTVVYAFSGVVLIYRDTDMLKSRVLVEKALEPGLSPQALSEVLHLRRVKFSRSDGAVLSFRGGGVQNGSYDVTTGAVRYSEKKLPAFIDRLTRLHKINSSKTAHWFAVGYGVLLLFLALSSLFMFKPGTTPFRRGLAISGAGIVGAVVLLLFV